MTYLSALIPAILATAAAASGSSALGPAPVGAAPDTPRLLLQPRSGDRLDLLPPMADTFRCEPVLRIEDGTPAAFHADANGHGVDRSPVARLCAD